MITSSVNTILITGATGFIGSHLAMHFSKSDDKVKLLVRDPNKLGDKLKNNCEIVTGDLGDMKSLRKAVENTTIIFHCAANVKTWDSWDNYYKDNVIGVSNLLEAIESEKPKITRFVHLSSVDVYGFPDNPCDESCKIEEERFGYGKSKIQGEKLLKEYAEKNNLPYTILRPCNVIGPGSQFISRIGKELKSGLMLTIDHGKSNAGLLYIDNLVQHMLWAAQSEKAVNQVFNVRDSCDINWSDFISKLKSGINGKGVVINLPLWLANTVANVFDLFHHVFLQSKEPLLHPLLVQFFAKTCGHNANKIHHAHKRFTEIQYKQAMDNSCQWFLNR